LSETNREDDRPGEGSFSDPTSGSSDWQAPAESERPDLTQPVVPDATQTLPGDSGAAQDEPGAAASPVSAPSAPSAASPSQASPAPPPPPPPPYPAPGLGGDTGSGYPAPGQQQPYGSAAYPPPPGAPTGAPTAPAGDTSGFPGASGAPVPPPPAPGPYGEGTSYGTPAYGASPYGDPNAPYGTPPPAYYQQAPSQTNNSALVLTILSAVGMFACCGVTIVSLILGILGLAKQASDPEQSRKLTKWGWIAFAAGFVLGILAFVAWVAGMIAWAPETYIEPDF